MDDARTIEILKTMLEKYDLTPAEAEALRVAIGILGWTKLVEGWKERKKQRRDAKLNDEE